MTNNLELSKAWEARLKLRAEADKLWAEAIIKVYGNIKMEWKYKGNSKYDCELENGEIYRDD